MRGEKMKNKINLKDNFIIYLLVAYLLVLVGQIIGSLAVNFPIGFYAGFKAARTGQPFPDVMNNLPAAVTTASMYLAFLGIWLVAILWCLKKNNRPILTAISTKVKGNNFGNLLIGLAIGAGLNGASILGAYLNGDIHLYFDSIHPISLVLIFISVFIQSSAEELICRGYLMQKLLRRYKKTWIAIIGNAVLFSALHLGNDNVGALALANILFSGILFSLMTYYMDSIWAAFAAHAAWNFTQNIIFGLPNSGNVVPYSIFKLEASTARDSFFYNVGFGVEATVFATILLIVACVLLALWGIKTGKKITNVWPEEAAAQPAEETVEQA